MPAYTHMSELDKHFEIKDKDIAKWLKEARDITGINFVLLSVTVEISRATFLHKRKYETRYSVNWPTPNNTGHQIINFGNLKMYLSKQEAGDPRASGKAFFHACCLTAT